MKTGFLMKYNSNIYCKSHMAEKYFNIDYKKQKKRKNVSNNDI